MSFLLKSNDIVPSTDMSRSGGRSFVKSTVSSDSAITVYVGSDFGGPTCRRLDLMNAGTFSITFMMQGGGNFTIPTTGSAASLVLAPNESVVFFKNDGYDDSVVAEKVNVVTPPTVIPDLFLMDVYNWTGSAPVADAAFQNFFALAGLAHQAGGTAGINVAAGVATFPAKTKPSGVIFSTRIAGTVAGPSGTAREWKVQTRRPDGTTVVGSADSSKFNGTDISNHDAALISHTLSATDPFTAQGVMVGLQNDSGAAMTLTSVSVRIYRQINAE